MTAEAAAPADSGKAASRALRILVVDDSHDNRSLIRAYLKETPYRLEMADNGRSGLEKFIADTWDIVLMDLQMPVMNGFDAARAMRSFERESGLRPTPIIGVTSCALEDDLRRSLEAGCDAYLTKPLKRTTLLETIGEYSAGGGGSAD